MCIDACMHAWVFCVYYADDDDDDDDDYYNNDDDYYYHISYDCDLCSQIFAELGDAVGVHGEEGEDLEEPLHRGHVLGVHRRVKLAVHDVLQLVLRLVQQLERRVQGAAWN